MPSIGHYEKVRALAGANGLLAVGGVRHAAASRISLLAVRTAKVTRTIDLPTHVFALAFAGKSLLAGCLDGTLRVFDSESGSELRKLEAHKGGTWAIAISADGTKVATAGQDGAARLWSLADGRKLGEWALSSAPLRAVALDPDGEYLAAAGDDAVVRSITLASGEKREMSGHSGAVRALAFTPRDGRVASAGDDGTIRLWYLVGEIEFEVRGEKDTGHAGGVTALLFPPTPHLKPDGSDPGDRLFSAGMDGKVKVWRLEDRRRPRTLDGGEKPLYALAFVANASATAKDTNAVYFGGDRRLVHYHLLDAEGAPGDKTFTWEHGFDTLAAALRSNERPGREAAVKTLASLEEREALEMLLGALEKDKDAEVRALAARQIAANGRRNGRAALKERLSDDSPIARGAAFEALLTLDKDSPLLALKAGLASKHADIRVRALPLLPPLRQSSPLVHGMVADRIADGDAGVRRVALEQLLVLSSTGVLEPLRLAYERGPADVKAEVLVRGLVAGILSARGFAEITSRALDDADPAVRRTAFAGKVLERPALAAAVESKDGEFSRTSLDILRRIAFLRRPVDARPAPASNAMTATSWKGRIFGPGENYPFVLSFDKYDGGELHGKMDWGKLGALAVKGTYSGDKLDFVDYAVLSGSGSVGDRKQVTISGDKMTGTDRGGSIKLEATRQGSVTTGPAVVAPTDAEVAAARAAIPAAAGSASGASVSENDLEPLLAAMACRSADTALRGARALASLGDTRALGALLQLSRESDVNLRRDAAASLAALSDPRAKKRLAWMLDDADASVRAAALDSFSKLETTLPLGPAGVALRSAQVDIRTRGLDALVKLPEASRAGDAESLLEDALEDEAPKVRAEAFRALWSWHDKDVQTAIDRALTARFPDLRVRAVQELAARDKEPWSLPRLRTAIADRDAGVAKAAYDAVVKIAGKTDAGAHLAAIESTQVTLRTLGAQGLLNLDPADRATAERARSPLMKLLQDLQPSPRLAALESLNKLFPDEPGPLYAALQSGFFDLKIRAAELLALRRDEQILDSMRLFLTDKDLERVLDANTLLAFRQRAASALATLGSPRNVGWMANVLLKSEQAPLREQAARGMANGARRGDEGVLLDALAHADAWVRSWASDGLARLGDARALPVLTGNLKAEHLPIRVGAILSFAALGPDGYGGMLQGLEDPSRDVQDALFAVVMARDLRAFRRNEAPDLLASALASARAEVRYAAARALELRTDAASYLGHLTEVLLPPKPDKAADMKDWPAEEVRERLAVGLAEALAGDHPEQRYAAAQVLLLTKKPLDWFREARNVGGLRSMEKPWSPDNTPRGPASTDTVPKPQRLRKLFMGAEGTVEADVADTERARLRWLAFGSYVGLLRQDADANDETHRVRRDAADRIVEIVVAGLVNRTAAMPALTRAISDKSQLVRKAAFQGLKKLYQTEPEVPLTIALGSTAPDIARTALEELAARGASARERITAALDAPLPDVRRFAFETLEKLYPPGSLEPLLAAIGSEYGDLRIGVIERIAASNDARATEALEKAAQSDHEDLRLRAAELLALRKDDHAINILGGFLRHDDEKSRTRALESLVGLGSLYAAEAIVHRLVEAASEEVVVLLEAIGRMRRAESIGFVCERFDDETEAVRNAAFDAALSIAGEDRKKRDPALAMTFLALAVRSRDPSIRARAAAELDHPADPRANELLVGLFSDRDKDVRVAAVSAYSLRVRERGSDSKVLEKILADGARELMLPAAEGVAAKGGTAALRPLLLFARAGEDGERERAVLALGTLADIRALEEIEVLANGGTAEAPASSTMKAAAVEALGRMANRIPDPDTRTRVIDKVERESREGDSDSRTAAANGLGAIGGERGRVRLEQLLSTDSDSDVTRASAIQLGKIGDAASEKVLADALGNDDDDTRSEARKSLDKIFPKDRARIELAAAKSAYEDVSKPAVKWLGTEGSPAAIVPRLPDVSDNDLRSALRFALIRRGAMPVPELAALLGHEKPSAREDAATIAGAGGASLQPADAALLSNALAAAERKAAVNWATRPNDRDDEATAWQLAIWAGAACNARALAPSATALLTGSASAAPAEVRREAARALGKIGSAADVGALTTALGDSDAGVRLAAGASLVKLDPGRSGALAAQPRPVDPLSVSGITPGTDTVAGWRALLAGLLSRKEVARIASVATLPGDATVKLDAVSALGIAGGPEAVAALKNLAAANGPAAKDEPLRRAAFKALRRAQRRVANAARHEARR